MATQKYLDYDGLLYFWQKLKNYFVADVTYNSSSKKIQKTKAGTTSDVVTLATVATSGSYNDLSNKPTIPSGVEKTTTTPLMDGTASIGSETKFAAGDHVHPSDTSKADKSTTVTNVAWDSTNNKLTKTINSTTSDVVTIATLKSAIGSATTSNEGLMTTAQATKLDGITDGAEPNRTYTSFTGKPTANATPAFGGTVTISQIKQSTTGQVSGTDRTITIPNTVASSSANGLMSSADKDKLDNISGSTLDLVAGNNITLTPNTTSGSLTISATDTTYSSGTATELTNGTVTNTRVWTPKILHDYVTGAIETAVTGSASFQGTAPTSFAPTNYKKGYYWVVGTAGTYCGQDCEPGDMIFAVEDYSSAYSASDFNIVQTNLNITAITNAEIDTIVAS